MKLVCDDGSLFELSDFYFKEFRKFGELRDAAMTMIVFTDITDLVISPALMLAMEMNSDVLRNRLELVAMMRLAKYLQSSKEWNLWFDSEFGNTEMDMDRLNICEAMTSIDNIKDWLLYGLDVAQIWDMPEFGRGWFVVGWRKLGNLIEKEGAGLSREMSAELLDIMNRSLELCFETLTPTPSSSSSSSDSECSQQPYFAMSTREDHWSMFLVKVFMEEDAMMEAGDYPVFVLRFMYLWRISKPRSFFMLHDMLCPSIKRIFSSSNIGPKESTEINPVVFEALTYVVKLSEDSAQKYDRHFSLAMKRFKKAREANEEEKSSKRSSMFSQNVVDDDVQSIISTIMTCESRQVHRFSLLLRMKILGPQALWKNVLQHSGVDASMAKVTLRAIVGHSDDNLVNVVFRGTLIDKKGHWCKSMVQLALPILADLCEVEPKVISDTSFLKIIEIMSFKSSKMFVTLKTSASRIFPLDVQRSFIKEAEKRKLMKDVRHCIMGPWASCLHEFKFRTSRLVSDLDQLHEDEVKQ